ncbi:DUF2946 domain-containing protein [Stutzerimonas zhaodongensis]|jgi:hypothetical protein|uniref:DUF2946 domain-containing protein n=1 Tax=Stutzerimonas zhaodongensis TaxID=1176257 RepID=UPI001F4EEAD9|nr:DUF2946 domain-containing protein [Stutzerimonas zhaodongensis]UNG17219.1 DUF2946 domain-containing protein [Stutzerimonas zhaodongensis]
MTIVKDKRIQIIWVLFTCILLNAFVCSLNHGSHMGFELAMGQEPFCASNASSAGGDAFPSDVHELAEHGLDCPLCGSVFLAIAVLFALGWLGFPATVPLPRPGPQQRGPRYHWPSLNPRAP